MKTYTVRISYRAYSDIENLKFIITEQYKSPATASKYIQGIIDQLNSLSYSADSFPIVTIKLVSQFGNSVRRLNYKKMAIIYTISGNIVIIQRVLPGALFTE